jgi:hypothetical protein
MLFQNADQSVACLLGGFLLDGLYIVDLLAAPLLAVPAPPGFHALVDLQKIGVETMYGIERKKVSKHDQDRGSE